MDQQKMFSPLPIEEQMIFFFISFWMLQISPLKHHLYSVLIVCQEAGEKLSYRKENE